VGAVLIIGGVICIALAGFILWRKVKTGPEVVEAFVQSPADEKIHRLLREVVARGADEVRLTRPNKDICVSYLVNGKWIEEGDNWINRADPDAREVPAAYLRDNPSKARQDVFLELKDRANVPFHDWRKAREGQMHLTLNGMPLVLDIAFVMGDDGEEGHITIKRPTEKEVLGVAPMRANLSDRTPASHANDAPLIRIVNALLSDAIKHSAEEIVLVRREGQIAVDLLVGGDWREHMKIPLHIHASVFRRLKMMCQISYYARTWPREGRTEVILDGIRRYDLLVRFDQTDDGEKATIKITGPIEQPLEYLPETP
jgi:hypothetical protein